MLLALAALPSLFWDAPPTTAPALLDAGIRRITVPGEQLAAWRNIEGLAVEAANLNGAVKLKTPAVNYRFEQASASRVPWLDSNGWHFLRRPEERFYYDAPGAAAALAAAEAFAWRIGALVKTDEAGLKPLGQMLEFVGPIDTTGSLQAVADFGFIDDQTPVAGEVMNLLVRGNLLFRVVRAPDPKLPLTVRIGSKEYPADKAANPAVMAQMIRADLTDDRRSLRLYGSAVVVGRLEAAPGRARVHLINYDGARKVNGLRVRVNGEYPKHRAASAGAAGIELLDYAVASGATEFTLQELKTYAIVDLTR